MITHFMSDIQEVLKLFTIFPMNVEKRTYFPETKKGNPRPPIEDSLIKLMLHWRMEALADDLA